MPITIEIKAHINKNKADFIREILKQNKAIFKGLDHQIDTYFKVPNGRLKLREGNIENNLIFYQRENKKEAKQSDVILFQTHQNSNLKSLLSSALGILAIVDKKREIYFIDNVKFHLDEVKNLGYFMEIEAIDEKGLLEKRNHLLAQCNYYLQLFEINSEDLINVSYSDMIIQ